MSATRDWARPGRGVAAALALWGGLAVAGAPPVWGAVSLVLYGVFVFVQTVRHRDDFLAPDTEGHGGHVRPGMGRTAISAGLLLATLVAVVGLAKALTPAVSAGVAGIGAPKAVVGIVIAAVVLLPEGLAARRPATARRPAAESGPSRPKRAAG